MLIIRSKKQMRAWSQREHSRGRTIALVPTMGALHEGHASLIRRARKLADRVVVSVFVNPTQFAAGEDLARYPRPFRSDCAMCRRLGADVVFAPDAATMYPAGSETFVVQERLPRVLCGASRPTHFRGVLTVVLKLFHIVGPDVALFGRKDYQQTVVLRRMAADLDVPVRIVVCPTVRERDGLALSSRNRYLNERERAAARCVVRALRACRAAFRSGERRTARLRAVMRAVLREERPARIDYAEVVDADTLRRASVARPGDVAAVAVFIGRTRLIDNMALK